MSEEAIPIRFIKPDANDQIFAKSVQALSKAIGWPEWLSDRSSSEYPSTDFTTISIISELAGEVAREQNAGNSVECNWTEAEMQCFKSVLPILLSTVFILRRKEERHGDLLPQSAWKTPILAFIIAFFDFSKDPEIDVGTITYQLETKFRMPFASDATSLLGTAEFTMSTITPAFNDLEQLDENDSELLSWLHQPDKESNSLNVLQSAIEFAASKPHSVDPLLRLSIILAVALNQHRALKIRDDFIFGMTSTSKFVTVYASFWTLCQIGNEYVPSITIAELERTDMSQPLQLLRFFCLLLSLRRHFLKSNRFALASAAKTIEDNRTPKEPKPGPSVEETVTPLTEIPS